MQKCKRHNKTLINDLLNPEVNSMMLLSQLVYDADHCMTSKVKLTLRCTIANLIDLTKLNFWAFLSSTKKVNQPTLHPSFERGALLKPLQHS